jgi:hypothetical protein
MKPPQTAGTLMEFPVWRNGAAAADEVLNSEALCCGMSPVARNGHGDDATTCLLLGDERTSVGLPTFALTSTVAQGQSASRRKKGSNRVTVTGFRRLRERERFIFARWQTSFGARTADKNNVRSRRSNGRHLLGMNISHFDPQPTSNASGPQFHPSGTPAMRMPS